MSDDLALLLAFANAPLYPAERRYLQAMADDEHLELEYCMGGGWWLGLKHASGKVAWSLIRRSLVSRSDGHEANGCFERYRPNGMGLAALAGKPAESALVAEEKEGMTDLLSDDLRALASRLNEGVRPTTCHRENSAIYAMVAKAVALEADRNRLAEAENANRNRVAFKHVDATPNDGLPIRILTAYREDCNLAWATTTDGTPSDSPLVASLNELQRQRASILDRALAALISLPPSQTLDELLSKVTPENLHGERSELSALRRAKERSAYLPPSEAAALRASEEGRALAEALVLSHEGRIVTLENRLRLYEEIARAADIDLAQSAASTEAMRESPPAPDDETKARLGEAAGLLGRWLETCAVFPDQTANRAKVFHDTDRFLMYAVHHTGRSAEETWVPHVVKEGSREHVVHWDTNGAHCSEERCEVNRPPAKEKR